MLTPFLLFFSAAIFVTYVMAALCMFGVPTSLSATYYLFNYVKDGLGNIFSIMMSIVGVGMLPAWIAVSDAAAPWSSNLTFLAFICCASILFVGFAPQFADNPLTGNVHIISAVIALACSLAWSLTVMASISIYIVAISFLCWAAACMSKTGRDDKVFWIEMSMFVTTYVSVIYGWLTLFG